jgi:hypothetical protein
MTAVIRDRLLSAEGAPPSLGLVAAEGRGRKDKRRNRMGPVPGAIPGCETLLRSCRNCVSFAADR